MHGGCEREVMAELGWAVLSTRHREAMRAVAGPAADLLVADLRMKLNGGAAAVLERLVFECGVGADEKFGAGWQLKTFAVPLIDGRWPFDVVDRGCQWLDWVVANADSIAVIEADFRSKEPSEHLGAKADAEERLAFAQWYVDPIGFGFDEVVGIVGALWAAENDSAIVMLKCFRQRIAKAGTANIKHVAHIA